MATFVECVTCHKVKRSSYPGPITIQIQKTYQCKDCMEPFSGSLDDFDHDFSDEGWCDETFNGERSG